MYRVESSLFLTFLSASSFLTRIVLRSWDLLLDGGGLDLVDPGSLAGLAEGGTRGLAANVLIGPLDVILGAMLEVVVPFEKGPSFLLGEGGVQLLVASEGELVLGEWVSVQ